MSSDQAAAPGVEGRSGINSPGRSDAFSQTLHEFPSSVQRVGKFEEPPLNLVFNPLVFPPPAQFSLPRWDFHSTTLPKHHVFPKKKRSGEGNLRKGVFLNPNYPKIHF